jgi:hypothetical protein
MADPDRIDKPTPPAGGDTSRAGRKKPYTKPGLRVERVFETTALACGKVSTTQSQCRLNRKLS